MKKLINGKLVKKIELVDDSVFSYEIYVGDVAKEIKAGQFCSVYVDSKEHILPRPISICKVNREANTITLVFQILGKGTNILSDAKKDTMIKLLIPLGNGYTIVDKPNVALVGGGIGVPPLVELEKTIKKLVPHSVIDTYIGFREDPFLVDEFENINVSTDNGSVGFHGNVLDLLKSKGKKYDVIYACGPEILLRFLSEYAIENNIECYISMEERMACSIGACVGCVVKINDEYKKVCVDGPVFNCKEVNFND